MHRYIRSGFESRQTKPHFARNAQVPGPQGPLPPSAARPQGHGWRQACPACQPRRPCPGGPAPARAPGPQRAASGGPRQRKGRLGRALASKQALWAPPASHAARLRPAHAPARCREPVRNLAVRGESAKSGWDARRKPQTGPCGPARICNAADRPSPRFSHPRTGCEQVPQGSAIFFEPL